MKRVAALAGHKARQWPIVVTHIPVKWSHCTRTLTQCGHKANKPSRCTRWPLRQTNVVVPDTGTFAVDLENWASLERPKATHYSTITASNIDKSV